MTNVVYVEIKKIDYADTAKDFLERFGNMTHLVDRNLLKEWRDTSETEC